MIYIYIILINFIFASIHIVPENFPNIQSAINYSNNNDTILVHPGTYYENIIIDNKYIALLSSSGTDLTIIDGNNNGPAILFNNIEEDYLIIEGFTIQNGNGLNINGARFGGGILSDNSKLILNNLVVQNNTAFAGGGICFYATEFSNKHPIINNVIIKNNYASEGGGIFCVNHYLSISNANIIENGMDLYGSGGGIQILLSDIYLNNVSIIENETKFGGGIYISNSNADFYNVLIEENFSDSKGGGIWVGGGTQLNLVKSVINNNQSIGFGGGIFVSLSALNILNSNIINNIIDSNVMGAGIYMDGGESIINNSIIYFNYQQDSNDSQFNLGGYSSTNYFEYDISYSNIEGNGIFIPEGQGIIAEDPLFIDANSNFNLLEESPCIDSGDPTILDEDMTISDMGAFPFLQNLIGDINNDLNINVVDVVIVMNIIFDNQYINNADFNEDGIINIQDIIMLVNIILNF